jgi:DNA-binding transcriptional LysR family regulator
MAIVFKGTVHGAAQELGLTQTAVTQRIRAVERDLKATLFLRSRKGMRLTAEGEALLRYCRSAEELEGQALSQITGAAKGSAIAVTIVGPTSVTTARLVDQCVGLYSRWPTLHLNFAIEDLQDRIDWVRAGRATFAIVSPDQVPKEMQGKMLKPDKYILVASARWKGRRLTDILENEKVIDFGEQDRTTFNYLKEFGLAHHGPRVFANGNEAIIKLFAAGVGFGTLTHDVAKPHLDSGALIPLNGGATMGDPLALAWYPRAEMPAYLKDIVHSIK